MSGKEDHELHCGSGHEHHEHDHHHEHGHHHEHEHHHHEAEKIPSVSVYTHDIATVGSVKCRIPGTYEEALERLKACMQQTADRVEQLGGLVGHVKAFAREEARNCMISVTDGEDMQCRYGHGNGIYVESANIVFQVAPEQMESILREAFQEYL